MAVMGCTLLVGSGSDVTVDATGVALAVGAGASYAIYTQFSARIVGRVPPDLAAAAAFGLGALLLLPVLALTDQSWLRSARGLAVALELGLVATALAYVLYTRALTVLAASTAVTLALAEPVVASILGVAILGERLTLAAWAGAAMIAAGLLLLTLQRSTAYEP
jgi:DME family drug/metabolite transporter